MQDIYLAVLDDKPLWEPRSVPHRCIVSSNIESYFVRLTAEADKAVLDMLEGRTRAASLSELRMMDAARSRGRESR